MKHSVDEQELNNLALCPLMGASVSVGCLEQIAVKLLTRAILRSYHGEAPSIADLREDFTKLWTEEAPASSVFAASNSRGVAKRGIDFLRRFQILHPVLPYELAVADHTIHGRFALVQKNTAGGYPMVLVLHGSRPDHSAYPNPLSLARAVSAKMEDPQYKRLGIYHLPLLRGLPWKADLADERLARGWLKAILDSLTAGRYASPGAHCRRCLTHACLEVYNH